MSKNTLLLVTFSSLLIHTAQVHADRVDDFLLLDHQGDAHRLYYHQSASAIVLMVQDNQCAEAKASSQQLQSLAGNSSSDTRFFMLNASLKDSRADIAHYADALKLDIPILDDETQLIGESLNLSKAGEVLIINPDQWSIVHRGSVDSAKIALDNLQNGKPAASNATISGCDIEFPQKNSAAHQQISYSKTIAPMLKDKCVSCHTEGGLGPWAMSSYNMVLGFAPMIREVIRTQRMPPWHADPHVGVWKNDISLTNKQTQALVHWIEAGAPRGEGADPLAESNLAVIEWPLGEPDLVVDIPPHTVPASGVVDYQFPTVKNPLDKGVWVKAAAAIPGDREVVHHILAGSIDADASEQRRNSGVFDNYLMGYAPGNESHRFPEGTGVFIPPGGEFQFQMHYTPVGRETVDRSKIGLYFHEEVPENFYRQQVVVDPTIKIPPNTARHPEVAYYEFAKPAMLHDLIPHAHYRGVASRFELIKPDGSREMVLNVPNYDFNWQRTYEFVTPRRIEPGTKLVHTTWYDNSAANPKNPDPDREVPWGLQSWDEMLYGGFSYTYVDETTESPIHDKLRDRSIQTVGIFDENFDGKLSWREMPRQLKKRLVQGFKAVDKNGDGGLDVDEIHQITLRQENNKQADAAGAR